MNSARSNSHSLKHQRFTPPGWKVKEIKKLQFVASNQLININWREMNFFSHRKHENSEIIFFGFYVWKIDWKLIKSELGAFSLILIVDTIKSHYLLFFSSEKRFKKAIFDWF